MKDMTVIEHKIEISIAEYIELREKARMYEHMTYCLDSMNDKLRTIEDYVLDIQEGGASQ